MCYFGFGDRGEEKKICNSQCFYFHICDIDIFGENFPLNSEIGQNYSIKRCSSKISQKTIYCQKGKKFLLNKKWGRTALASPPSHCPFWGRIWVLSFGHRHKNAKEVSSSPLLQWLAALFLNWQNIAQKWKKRKWKKMKCVLKGSHHQKMTLHKKSKLPEFVQFFLVTRNVKGWLKICVSYLYSQICQRIPLGR